MWETLQVSLGIVFQIKTILVIIFSTFMGILIGVIPGLGSFVAIVIMIPFVMNLAPETALMAIVGIYVGGMLGGGITSAVLGIPGTPMAAATLLDANPMSDQLHSQFDGLFHILFDAVIALKVCVDIGLGHFGADAQFPRQSIRAHAIHDAEVNGFGLAPQFVRYALR